MARATHTVWTTLPPSVRIFISAGLPVFIAGLGAFILWVNSIQPAIDAQKRAIEATQKDLDVLREKVDDIQKQLQSKVSKDDLAPIRAQLDLVLSHLINTKAKDGKSTTLTPALAKDP